MFILHLTNGHGRGYDDSGSCWSFDVDVVTQWTSGMGGVRIEVVELTQQPQMTCPSVQPKHTRLNLGGWHNTNSKSQRDDSGQCLPLYEIAPRFGG